MVLELLVDDEDHQHHDGRGQRVQGGYGDGHDGAQGRADQGNQVGEADEQGDDPSVGDAHDPQHDVGDGAGDDADHQVAGHVAGDRLGAVGGHPPDPFLTPFRQRGDPAGQQLGALQDHEEGEDEDGDQGHHGREDRPQHTQGGGGEAVGALAQPGLVALEVFVKVVTLDQGADRASPGAGLLDVAGDPVDELRALGGQGSDEQGQDAGQRDDGDQEYQQGGQRPAQAQSALGEVDQGAEDDGQQGGHHDPGQDAPDLPAEQQDRGGEQHHPDGGGDGADRDAGPGGRSALAGEPCIRGHSVAAAGRSGAPTSWRWRTASA